MDRVRNSAKKHIHRFLSPDLPNTHLGAKVSDLYMDAGTGSGATSSILKADFRASIHQNLLGSKPTHGSHRRVASGFDSSFERAQLFAKQTLLKEKSPTKLSFAQRAHEIDSIWNKSGRVTAFNTSSFQGKLGGLTSKPESLEYLASRTPVKHLGLGSPKYQSAWKSPAAPAYASDLRRVLSPTSAAQPRTGLLAGSRPVADFFSGFSKRRESATSGKPYY